MGDENVILEVRRDEVAETRLVTEDGGDPEDGQVRVATRRVPTLSPRPGLTS